MSKCFNLKLIILFLSLANLICASLNPIVLIPGDGGSQVEAKLNRKDVVHYICEKTSDYFNIWLNMELLVPLVIDCWIDNIKLIYDNETRTTRNPDGVVTRIPGFGGTETVEWLDPSHASTGAYFKDIANMLVSLGHERNKTLKGAPYDFRKAPNENQQFFVDLKKLVEDTYEENQKTPVILLAHSMGGLMSLHFLNQQSQSWKDKYIKSMVTLAGVWGGSMKALKVYAIGDDLGSLILRESVMRAQQITSPSLSWLLPSRLYWKPNEILIQTEKKNFTIDNLQEFFDDISYPNAWEMRKDTEPYQLNFKPPGVEVHCLFGVKTNTVEKLHYKHHKWWLSYKTLRYRLSYKPGTWLDGYPTLIYGDGDGTVNRRSLEGCIHWRGFQQQKIHAIPFEKVDHLQILKDANVLNYIGALINTI